VNVVSIYGRLYLECLRKTLASIGKSPWTLLLPMGLLLALQFAGMLAAPFGIASGLILGAVVAALGSCYLYFVDQLVGSARAQVAEFGRSVGAYFWSVANVLFVYWIAAWVLGRVLAGSPQAGAAHLVLQLVAVVLLNATPEVIYQRKSYGGLATLQQAIQFLSSNWLEWGIPNGLLLAALWLVNAQTFAAVVDLGALGWVVASVVVGALFHGVMVFRGQLFAALDGTSHRQRMFRYRSAA
jgi:hypothetical protein